MSHKTILLTGATDGIGFQTALELAQRGHTVLLHGRAPARAARAAQKISAQVKNVRVEPVSADFTSLAEVRALAAKVTAGHTRLDVLINNAGVFMKSRVLTPDGAETTFQVNHLAHFLLTLLLLDLIRTSAPSRIVNVSSGMHAIAQIDFDNLQGEKHYDGIGAYALAKLANVLFTYALAARLRHSGTTVNALHPGVVMTKLLKAGWSGGGAEWAIGAETPVYLADSPEVENVTGKYFVSKGETNSSAASHDKKLQARLWQVSAEMVRWET